MIIYKDVLTGDELFSDSYPIKLIDDCYYEIEGKNLTEKGEDYSAVIGANPSAEDGGDEAVETSDKSGINVVIAHKLVETGFAKKEFQVYIKEFMKKLIAKVKESEPERVDALKEKLQAKVKDIVANFKDYDFYIGESLNPEGCVLLLNYREDGSTPFFTVFKDAVEGEKY